MNRLLSYAYLKASHDQGQKNPLALLQQVVLDTLRKNRGKIITTSDVLDRVVSDWGIKIPHRVIQNIIRLPFLENFYEYIPNGKYKITLADPYFDRLADLDKKAESDLSRVMVAVNRELIARRLHTDLMANEVISKWLDTSAMGFFNADYEGVSGDDRTISAIVASCMGIGAARDENFVSSLSSLVMGDLLYRAMGELTEADTLSEDPEQNIRMKNVSMFLDVSIISHLAGYNLEEEHEATSDFIDMCKRVGCQIKVFDHTVAEFKKVCTANVVNIGRSQASYAGRNPMGAYCLATGRSPSAVMEEIADVESFLESNGIEIARTPGFETEKHKIEISGLDLLKSISTEFSGDVRDRIVYRSGEADYNDYLSLRGIYILRNAEPKKSLESCDAFFLTNTFKLQRVSNRFFKELFKEIGGQNEVQICFTEAGIAPRIWLKLPTEFSKVSRSQVIKIALGNLSPSKTMRESFRDYIKKLIDEKKISDVQALELRFSRYVDYALAIEGAFDEGKLRRDAIFQSIAEDALRESRSRILKARNEGKEEGLKQAVAEIGRLETLAETEIQLYAAKYAQQIEDLKAEVDRNTTLLAATAMDAKKRERRYRSILFLVAFIVLPGALFLSELLPIILGEEKFIFWKFAAWLTVVFLSIFVVSFGLESGEHRSNLARKWSDRRK